MLAEASTTSQFETQNQAAAGLRRLSELVIGEHRFCDPQQRQMVSLEWTDALRY